MSSQALDTEIEGLFNPHDIRGVWGEGLNERTVRQIIRAAVHILKGEEDAIILGRDARLSSQEIHAIAVEEITGAGLGLVDVGETATEVVYYSAGYFRLPGIMITASHNGHSWNGFKFCGPLAAPVGKDNGLWEIRRLAAENSLAEPDLSSAGPRSDESAMADTYAKAINQLVPLPEACTDLTIVVDAANGMANVVAPKAFDGLNIIWLADRIDGHFPDHEPNPLKSKNLAKLIETVKEMQADLGLAFDGDADRLILVNEHGEPVPPALAQAHIARLAINRFAKADVQPTVLYSEVSSQIVPMVIESAGAKAFQTPVGHSAIKKLMAEHGAIAAVEHSGHYYFDATYRADSALLAAALVLADLGNHPNQHGLSQRLADLPVWVMAEEENWTITDENHVFAMVREEIQLEPESLLGGGVAYVADGWRATLRTSNTEPLLRFNIEANAQTLLDTWQGAFRAALINAGAQLEGH